VLDGFRACIGPMESPGNATATPEGLGSSRYGGFVVGFVLERKLLDNDREEGVVVSVLLESRRENSLDIGMMAGIEALYLSMCVVDQ
jgi:hypothetical protein